jgi:hypothetical protein
VPIPCEQSLTPPLIHLHSFRTISRHTTNDYTGPSADCNDNLGRNQSQGTLQRRLDKAESEGPQLLQRRKTKFVLLTEAEWEGSRALEHTAAIQEPTQAAAGTRSLWDRLRLVPCDGIDPVFPRMQGKPRHIDF